MAKNLFKHEGYKWNYCSVGGVVRVNLNSGEDIAHLDELDQKKWTVLSCPVKGLKIDQKTLAILDSDADGHIRVNEVVAAAKWLTSIIKNNDSILAGASELELSNIDTTTDTGKNLLKAAQLVLKCLGKEAAVITLEDAENGMTIFNNSKFNGDAVIVDACTEDENLKKAIADIIACEGAVADASGADGVNEASIDKFIADCKSYAAWVEAGKADEKNILPYGDKTADAYAACNAVNSKIADYFMRCKLVKFNEGAADAVDVSVAKIAEIGGQNLSECAGQIAEYPLARPSAEGVLDLSAINPAWQAAISNAAALTSLKDKVTEESWAAVMASFAPYCAYTGAKAGAEVEALGMDTVKSYIENDPSEALKALIAQDAALAEEAAEIKSMGKLMHLYRDFYKFLNNYVVFSDLYAADKRAIFEAGELYIDQRCCKLCVEVADMGKHADMAGLSGMFLIYCSCTNKSGAKKDIAALMTAGDIRNLRPGKNCIFYDLEGNDWDAVVTKVVDNPINVRNAFWSPYRKAANFVSEKINKNMAAKESASEASVLGAADGKGKQAFDIAKFAGIFAAIGMAIGFILSALAGFAAFIGGLKWYQLILLVVAIMLVISGPSCFLAWRKLRKRNLGPVLNANGWAINSNVLINTVFGATLTSVAKYPVVKGSDPFKKKTPVWKKVLWSVVAALVVAFAALYFTNCLECVGLSYHKGDLKALVNKAGDAIAADAADMSSSLQNATENAESTAAAETPAE